ncbi:hypothetical protein [Maribellus sediminis]|uniref:hypothetical protein n=1 Tax=Maribellus sediminis TaxID=2696285 RepID=UPI0014310028|nr:hypothetical protein [Maribellus sediminis]
MRHTKTQNKIKTVANTVHIAGRGSVVRQLRPEASGLVSQFRVRQLTDRNALRNPPRQHVPTVNGKFKLKHMNIESLIQLKETKEDFKYWINSDFVSAEIKEDLNKASILFLPFIGQRRENEATFPSGTEAIYSYFKEKIDKEFSVDICIADELYQELALHSNYKRLGKFIVKSVALPVFLAVLSSYVYDTIIKPTNEAHQVYIENTDKESPKKYLEIPEVKFTIIVEDSSKVTKEFNYEGPANQVENITESIKKLWDAK